MRRIVLPCMAAALAASVTTAPAHAQPVSFTGSFNGTAVSQGPGRCGAGFNTVDLLVSGVLSPFGAGSGTQSFCVPTPPMPGPISVTNGLFDIAFVGGRLLGTFFGTLTPVAPPIYMGTSTLTITGGNGIFEGATGSGTTSGTQNIAAGTVTFGVTGSVSAPGLNAVPEPGTLALLAGGLVATAAVGRARRRRAVSA